MRHLGRGFGGSASPHRSGNLCTVKLVNIIESSSPTNRLREAPRRVASFNRTTAFASLIQSAMNSNERLYSYANISSKNPRVFFKTILQKEHVGEASGSKLA